MSTVYYIIDRKIEKEIKGFSDFLENKIMPYIEDAINEYCAKTDGKYINNDYAEEVLDALIPKLKYSQPNDDNYMFRVGHIWYGDKKPRFIWGQFHLDGFFIYDFESFKEFFKNEENKEKYYISEEGYKEIEVEEFIKILKGLA